MMCKLCAWISEEVFHYMIQRKIHSKLFSCSVLHCKMVRGSIFEMSNLVGEYGTRLLSSGIEIVKVLLGMELQDLTKKQKLPI